jgi:hypothetical protein
MLDDDFWYTQQSSPSIRYPRQLFGAIAITMDKPVSLSKGGWSVATVRNVRGSDGITSEPIRYTSTLEIGTTMDVRSHVAFCIDESVGETVR